MRVVGAGATNVGRTRKTNEDVWFADDGLGLYVVCDGMGGHQAGEVASALAIETLTHVVRSRRDDFEEDPETGNVGFELVRALETGVHEASRSVREIAMNDPSKRGMGTTLTALLLCGTTGAMAHVGDSRLYLQRAGSVAQLSVDHTFVNEMVLARVLSPDKAAIHPHRNVLTRSLGPHGAVAVDTLLFDIFPNDTYLLCSDGLHGTLTNNEELGPYLSRSEIASVPEELIALANERGGPDNVTAVVVRATPKEAHAAAAATRSELVNRRLDALAHCFLGSELTLRDRLRLHAVAEPLDLRPGDVVVQPSDPLRGLVVVVEGRLAVEPPGGATSELRAGECYGETALLAPHRAAETLRAVHDTHAILIDSEAFADVVRRRPRLGTTLLGALGRRLRDRCLSA